MNNWRNVAFLHAYSGKDEKISPFFLQKKPLSAAFDSVSP